MIKKQDKVEVTHVQTHLGHDLESKFTKMSKSKESTLASMLANHVDKQHILESKDVDGKVLNNINNKFNLNYENKHHSNDLISVDLFLEEFKKNGNYILCHKKLKTLDEKYPGLGKL